MIGSVVVLVCIERDCSNLRREEPNWGMSKRTDYCLNCTLNCVFNYYSHQ